MGNDELGSRQNWPKRPTQRQQPDQWQANILWILYNLHHGGYIKMLLPRRFKNILRGMKECLEILGEAHPTNFGIERQAAYNQLVTYCRTICAEAIIYDEANDETL